ncbi:N-acetylmuramoyl-L-alanine amidase [Nocardiopsis sp. NPDC101807]|uniref:N-acetylmuramoyl-L-alanine amidase n=1 Tax=Nocardiopsis sp. NPDC101807 TaxID=3364339 RepID=UPI0038070983
MVDIVSRSDWGARAPRNRQTVGWGSRTEVTLHYSEGPTSQSVRSIQNFHMDVRKWSDIGYNLLVDEAGVAYEGRGWNTLGAHAAPRNVQGVGICFIGRDGMTPAAKRTVVELYDEACAKAGRTLARKGHRDVSSTSCPGANNYAWWTSPDFRDIAGTNTEGNDPLIGLRKGSKGEGVKALQVLIENAGVKLTRYGVDGGYGDETAEGLRKVRASVGSEAKRGYGDEVTGWAYAQLMTAVARKQGGK